jgi:hypothetical protein
VGGYLTKRGFKLISYVYEHLTPRLTLAIAMASVLTADTVWLWADRDSDFISTINPWVTLILSILVMIWGIAPEKITHRLYEVLWFAHGWWVLLFYRLAFHPEPAQVDGWDRVSWLFVYFGMAVLALGLWFAARKQARKSYESL